MNKINYLLFPNTLTVVVKGKPYDILRTDTEKYNSVWRFINANDEDGLNDFLNVSKQISTKLGINISSNGIVSYLNAEGTEEVLPASLTKTLISMYEQDAESITPLVNFWEKLRLNPAYRPLNFLFDFISANNIVINESGNLIMYKIVARTEEPNIFLDLYTKTFKHEFGKAISIARNMVDDNIDNTCSHGLHVCTWNYLPHYGSCKNGRDAILLVEVNPKDIVAIPRDYNNSKLRVCSYIPLEEYTYDQGELNRILYSPTSYIDNDKYEDEEDNDEDYLDEYADLYDEDEDEDED